MIISFNKGFIFFGLPKSGSTSLHFLLSRHGDLVFSRLEHGKHGNCEGTHSQLNKLFAEYPYERFLKFGVIRDPAQLVASWYRVWSDPALADPANPNHARWLNGKSMDEFIDILETESIIALPKRFYSLSNGSLGVDYLIRLEHLADDMRSLETVLPVSIADKLQRTRLNPSYQGMATNNQSAKASDARLRELYKQDYDLYETAHAMNKNFLGNGWDSPHFNGGQKFFRQHYPKFYAMSQKDKRLNQLKRLKKLLPGQ